MKKRYQYWTKEGIKWTPWFNVKEGGSDIQFKGRNCKTLLNEYED